MKSVTRAAGERRPGVVSFAETMMNAYNNKNKYRLSLRTLYGGRNVVTKEEQDENLMEEGTK